MSQFYQSGSNQPRPRRALGDLPYWLVTLLLLFVFPPVGVLMLVVKLFGGGSRKSVGRHPYYAQKSGPAGARTVTVGPRVQSGGQNAQEFSPLPLQQLAKRARRLTTVGAVLTVIFGFYTVVSLSNAMYWLFSGDYAWFLEDILPPLTITAGGLGCLLDGQRLRSRASRWRSLLAMIGRHSSISVSSLASATGLSAQKVRDELEDMLSSGVFPTGYLDLSSDALILSGDGLQDPPPQPKEKPEAQQAPKADEEENAVLAEIRAINDAIDNQKLSDQIDRIGVITARIFDYQKQHPGKSPQLHSFLSYYLPTTLKILRAYAQLEDQEVEGENISAAMSRIEGMMDKVVEGFEKQLDQLFAGDAMDITTDVEVLEKMLQKDGLSSDGLTLNL